ncbi:MAG TPA: right-handed parallel beta-helix repeat-containing protein, partial [Candidatus Polarisedimenticolaceae bacterium]|nr:right-handed parallel beta-helix repeat-containing protein [Candidatus Polarisedimenticolaceae bacterium]
MNRIRLAAACAVALVSAGMALAATTYYVATNGNDNANCGSSASPCRHIQYAIDKSIDGDTVRVKNGTYNECFIVPTYLSGVLRVTVEADTFATAGTVGGAILDGTGACDAGSATPAPVAVVMYDSVLRGFKIQHGGNSGVLGLGAVAITNNTITGNASTYGGDPSFSYAGGGIFAYTGIYVTSDDTKLQIKSNTISSNTSSQSGGGIYVAANGDGFPSVVEIQNNTLTGNVAGPDPVPGSLGTFGGAIAVFTDAYTPADSSSVVITNNAIDGNTAHKTADGYPAYGGGIFVATGAYTGYGTETVQIGDVGASNAVRNNRAEGYGGGISADLQPGIATPGHTMKVVGNSVTANSGERGAGGIHGFFLTADPTGGLGTLEITDNTITGNHAEAPAGSGALGGGGLFGEIYSKKTPAQYIAFKIEGNRIQNNDSNSIGGGASLFVYADDNPPLNQGGNGIKLPAGAQIDFKNNLVAQNTAVNNAPDPGPVRIPSVGGGVWAAGRAFGDQAFAGIDLEFLTVAGNHVDAGAAGGIEL